MESYDISLIGPTDFEQINEDSLIVEFIATVHTQVHVQEVTRLRNYSPIDRETFSVVFKINEPKYLYEQGTYAVHHPKLGVLHLFLVPISADSKSARYEAVFS